MTNEEMLTYLQAPLMVTTIVILAIWSSVWKGFALYRAGANRSPGWFIVLFIVNTAGILEILYLFLFSRRRKREVDARLGLLP